MSERVRWDLVERFDGDVFAADNEELLTEAALEEYPHRDADVLEAALDETSTTCEAAESLGVHRRLFARWADAYGLERTRHNLVNTLEAMDPDDLGDGQEGSA